MEEENDNTDTRRFIPNCRYEFWPISYLRHFVLASQEVFLSCHQWTIVDVKSKKKKMHGRGNCEYELRAHIECIATVASYSEYSKLVYENTINKSVYCFFLGLRFSLVVYINFLRNTPCSGLRLRLRVGERQNAC